MPQNRRFQVAPGALRALRGIDPNYVGPDDQRDAFSPDDVAGSAAILGSGPGTANAPLALAGLRGQRQGELERNAALFADSPVQARGMNAELKGLNRDIEEDPFTGSGARENYQGVLARQQASRLAGFDDPAAQAQFGRGLEEAKIHVPENVARISGGLDLEKAMKERELANKGSLDVANVNADTARQKNMIQQLLGLASNATKESVARTQAGGQVGAAAVRAVTPELGRIHEAIARGTMDVNDPQVQEALNAMQTQQNQYTQGVGGVEQGDVKSFVNEFRAKNPGKSPAELSQLVDQEYEFDSPAERSRFLQELMGQGQPQAGQPLFPGRR